jgi:hypothetical protein
MLPLAELLLRVAHQRINIDIFDRLAVSSTLPVHATASGGLPYMDPVGSPVAGSTKTSRIHQGFQQQGTTPISRFPVARHLPRAQRQDLAGQSLDLHPRQDQKSAIVDNGLQVALPLQVAPADPLIPSSHLPRWRGPQQTGQLLLATADPVAQIRAEGHTTSEIVIPFHLFAPPAALGSAFHQGQFQRLALARDACDGRRFAASPSDVCPPCTPPAESSQRGKLE